MSTTTDRPPRPALPHRGRAWLLGVALPVAVTAMAWIWILTVRGDLPERVAVHWGLDGPDRWSSVTELLAVPAVLCALGLLICCPLAVLVGRQSFTRRMVVGLSAGMATMFAGIAIGTVRANLTDPVGDPVGPILLACLAGVVVGVAAGAAAGSDPVVRATEPVPDDAPRAILSGTERGTWLRSTGVPAPVVWALLATAVATGALVGYVSGWPWGLVLALPLAALLLGFLRFSVRVDHDGLTARSMLGLTVLRAGAEEVVRADVVEVAPFPEFGGWGLRTDVLGRTGLVTRKGEALRVERTGGRIQVVTVDDAARAAALLNTMAERARPVSRVEDAPVGDAGAPPTPEITPRGPAAGGRG